MKDEYGLEIPSKNLPLSYSFYELMREILKGQKLAYEMNKLSWRANYWKLKTDLYFLGIIENPYYDGEESSSISKYIITPPLTH